MNNPLQGPVTRPKQFVSSVFDLAYGARDGSEPLTAAEVNANLRESGINPDAAWSAASKILTASRDRLLLVEARRQRLADLAVEAKVSAFGSEMTIAELAETLGEKQNTVFYKIKRGWTMDEIIAGKRVTKRKPSKLTLAIDQIKADRMAGASIPELCSKYGYDTGNMSRFLMKNGIIATCSYYERKRKKRDEILRLRSEGLSVCRIARILGISESGAYYYVKKQNNRNKCLALSF